MLKKMITYEDYNGQTRTEPFYFNLSQADILELELGTEGTFTGLVQKIIDTQDTPKLIRWFKKLIMLSYGEKSVDGKRFIKSDELSEAFVQSPAYDVLLMEFFNEPNAASDFVNGIAPKEIDREKLAAAQKEATANIAVFPGTTNENN